MSAYLLLLIIHIDIIRCQIHQPLKLHHTTGSLPFMLHSCIPPHTAAFMTPLLTFKVTGSSKCSIENALQEQLRPSDLIKNLRGVNQTSLIQSQSCVRAEVSRLLPWPPVTSCCVCFLRPLRIPSALVEALYNLDLWKCLLI